MAKSLLVRGRALGQGEAPLVCVPLTGADAAAVCAEARAMAALVTATPDRAPDLLEWRADAFDAAADGAALLGAARALRTAAGDLPLLVTLRAAREGGRDHGLDDAARAALLTAMIDADTADLVDFEADAGPDALDALRAACRSRGVALVLSAHRFEGTPPVPEMVAAFRRAAAAGADVAKLAVMPRTPGDVEALLAATAEADRMLPIPLVSMSMGALGAASRVAGFRYGSRITWASGSAASAPGQPPLATLRSALAAELARPHPR